MATRVPFARRHHVAALSTRILVTAKMLNIAKDSLSRESSLFCVRSTSSIGIFELLKYIAESNASMLFPERSRYFNLYISLKTPGANNDSLFSARDKSNKRWKERVGHVGGDHCFRLLLHKEIPR